MSVPENRRSVTVDMTEQEARMVAAAIDFASAYLEVTRGEAQNAAQEVRQRFLNGIVIAHAEEILRGGAR